MSKGSSAQVSSTKVTSVRDLLSATATAMAIMGPIMVATPILAPAVLAQSGPQLLGSYGDWDAMTSVTRTNGKSCYIISKPKKTTANKQNVRRGDIYLTVTHRPKFKVTGEVNTVVGYPLKVSSEVRAQVDGKQQLRMFTEGRGAWLYDEREDARLVSQMKAGINLVIKGTSTRGTQTTDTYSLKGFTAAYNAITRACRN